MLTCSPLSNEAQCLLALLRGDPSAALPSPLRETHLLSVCAHQSIEGLLMQRLRAHPGVSAALSPSAHASLKHRYDQQLIRRAQYWHAYRGIHDTLDQERIAHIPFKGIIADELLHGGKGMRPVGTDIDILVRRADGSRAISVLKAHGYASATDDLLHHQQQSFQKNGITVDLHLSLLSAPLDTIDESLLWQRAHSLTVHNTAITVMDPYDTLLSCALQTRYNLPNVKLWRLLDARAILCNAANPLSCEMILARARQWKHRNALTLLLLLAHALIGAPLSLQIRRALLQRSIRRTALNALLSAPPSRLLKEKAGALLLRPGLNTLIKPLLIDSPRQMARVITYRIRNSIHP